MRVLRCVLHRLWWPKRLVVSAIACGAIPCASQAIAEQPLVSDGILFVSSQDGDQEIFLTKGPGFQSIQLTRNGRDDTQAVWSPDGSKIAFTSMRDGNAEIYIMDADGSNQRRLTKNAFLDAKPRWSPDGKYIAFRSMRNRRIE